MSADVNTEKPGWANRLGQMWLREKAKELRASSKRCDAARYTGELGAVARQVGEQYRRAAQVLEDAVASLEPVPADVH